MPGPEHEENAIGADLAAFEKQLSVVWAALSDKTDVVVRITEGDLGSAEAETEKTIRTQIMFALRTIARGRGGDVSNTTFNTNPANDWRLWTDLFLDETLLHELMHSGELSLGKDDQDGTKTIFDPYKVAALAGISLADMPEMQALLDKAKKACKKECDANKGGAPNGNSTTK